ncbi:CAAX prenyl protease-related protein [Massilia glaciei]|uniref:CAAX prenyl protease-related protein n=1 Tax=Massilia glaciei TaxID=1524097 RepID=A0A2U2HC30_9BURK|nr:CAAX prenyl protease-related protein [Massilia glaciei]PWF40425.1 CAAX prenyl protease-related protein [Massilia glaciei]
MAEQDEQSTSAGSSPAAAPPAADGPLINRAVWARILPFLTYILFIVVHDALLRLGWAAAELRWLYALKIGAVMVFLGVFWRQYTELHRFTLSPAAAALACAAGLLVLVLWINLEAPWMVLGGAAGFDPNTDGRIDWLLVAVRLAGAALVVPVMEELFWRSFLLRWVAASDFERVDPARVGLRAAAATVVLFGFEHNLWLAGMLAGAAFTALYCRHRTLWSPILAHAVANAALGVWVVATGSWRFW